jgi:hypothetical protein
VTATPSWPRSRETMVAPSTTDDELAAAFRLQQPALHDHEEQRGRRREPAEEERLERVAGPTFFAAASSGRGARFGLTGGATPTEPPGRTPVVPASRGSLRARGGVLPAGGDVLRRARLGQGGLRRRQPGRAAHGRASTRRSRARGRGRTRPRPAHRRARRRSRA